MSDPDLRRLSALGITPELLARRSEEVALIIERAIEVRLEQQLKELKARVAHLEIALSRKEPPR